MSEQEVKEFLNRLGEQSIPAPAHLAQRVLANLPEREPALLSWLLAGLWRPLAAATLPLLFGFAVGLNWTPDTELEADTLLFADSIEEYVYDEL